MNKNLIFLSVAVGVFCFFVANHCYAKEKTYGDVLVHRVVRVYDGDTFFADIKGWPPVVGENIGIRVAGIDTPEVRTKNAEEKQMARTARRLAENLLKRAEKIELRNIRRGKYFRVVADVYVDGKSLADLLIKNNLARPYDGGTKQPWP